MTVSEHQISSARCAFPVINFPNPSRCLSTVWVLPALTPADVSVHCMGALCPIEDYPLPITPVDIYVPHSMGALLHGRCLGSGHGHSHGLGGHGHGHSHGSGGEHSASENINVRAATIHVLGDLIQSIGVLVAALIIKFKVRLWAVPFSV